MSMSPSPFGKENNQQTGHRMGGGGGAKTPPSAMKRSRPALRPQTPQEATQELPPEFDVPSDSPAMSPAMKKSRMSDMRKSRVSFGGVQMKIFLTDTSSTSSVSDDPGPTPDINDCDSDVSMARSDSADSDASTLLQETSSYQGRPSMTEPIPSLADVLDADETTGLQSHLNFEDGDETKPMPKLRDLGDLDGTATIDATAQLRARMDMDATPSMTVDLQNSSLEMTTSLSSVPAPSLKGLLARTIEPQPDSGGSLDDSMEMTACYGHVIQELSSAIGNPARPSTEPAAGPDSALEPGHGSAPPAAAAAASPAPPPHFDAAANIRNIVAASAQRRPVPMSPCLAAANATTFASKPPQSPHLKNLLAARDGGQAGPAASSATPAAVFNKDESPGGAFAPSPHGGSPTASPARIGGMIGMMIPSRAAEPEPPHPAAAGQPHLSPVRPLTPQLKNLMKRKANSLLTATADMPSTSPLGGTGSTPPALLRAGSRLTLTPSGAQSPFKSPKPAESPAAVATDMDTADAAAAGGAPLEEEAGGDEDKMEMTAELSMPVNIPEQPLASPVAAAHQSNTAGRGGRQGQASQGGAVLRDMIRRRSSMMPPTTNPVDFAAETARNDALLLAAPISEGAVERESAEGASCRSFSQFLAMADLHFLDDMSTDRRATLMVRGRADPPETLEECKLLLHTTLPELQTLQAGCDQIIDLISAKKETIAQAERAANANPPELFAQLATSARNSEESTALRGQLATLKRICRQEAKTAWYKWYGAMAKEMEEQAEQEKVTVLDEAQVTAGRISIYEAKYKELCQVMEGLGLEPLHGVPLLRTEDEVRELVSLESEAEKQRAGMAELSQQTAALRAQNAELEAAKRGLEADLSAMAKTKHRLVCSTNAAADASLGGASGVHQAARLYEALQRIGGVELQAVCADRVAVRLCGAHLLEIRCEGDTVAQSSLRLFDGRVHPGPGGGPVSGPVSGPAADAHSEFLRGLVECADTGSVVSGLCGRSRACIVPAVNELCFRLGRCAALAAEVKGIEQQLKLLVTRDGQDVAVDFTSLGRGLKFRLAFTGLSFCYPAHTHDETAVEVIPVIGELPAELVQAAVDRHPRGVLRRLHRICRDAAAVL